MIQDRLLVGLLLVGVAPALAGEPTLVFPSVCEDGIHRNPSGHFDVIVFCDDAQGTNIAVTLTRANDYPATWSGDWGYATNRFWQDPSWARDVNSYCWSDDGGHLYVSTGEVYGSGLVFELNVATKRSRVLTPVHLRSNEQTTNSVLTACPNAAGEITWNVESWSDKLDKTVTTTATVSVR